jgi:nicotinate-nucleotide pyrophosphorylase (carboxylating)
MVKRLRFGRHRVTVSANVRHVIEAVRAQAPQLACEVEMGTLDELDEALAAGVSLMLPDNMTVPQCAEAVRCVVGSGAGPEVSGGADLDVARAYCHSS